MQKYSVVAKYVGRQHGVIEGTSCLKSTMNEVCTVFADRIPRAKYFNSTGSEVAHTRTWKIPTLLILCKIHGQKYTTSNNNYKRTGWEL